MFSSAQLSYIYAVRSMDTILNKSKTALIHDHHYEASIIASQMIWHFRLLVSATTSDADDTWPWPISIVLLIPALSGRASTYQNQPLTTYWNGEIPDYRVVSENQTGHGALRSLAHDPQTMVQDVMHWLIGIGTEHA